MDTGMKNIPLNVNGRPHVIPARADSILLWVLRDRLGLLGVRYGCGIGECGFCSVLLDGRPVRSCQVTVGEVEGHAITTIEGVPEDHPVVRAWIEEQVPQCGYCQPAQVLHAVSLLAAHPDPDEVRVIEWMDPVLCRCGTYPRIRRAIARAAHLMRGQRG